MKNQKVKGWKDKSKKKRKPLSALRISKSLSTKRASNSCGLLQKESVQRAIISDLCPRTETLETRLTQLQQAQKKFFNYHQIRHTVEGKTPAVIKCINTALQVETKLAADINSVHCSIRIDKITDALNQFHAYFSARKAER